MALGSRIAGGLMGGVSAIGGALVGATGTAPLVAAGGILGAGYSKGASYVGSGSKVEKKEAKSPEEIPEVTVDVTQLILADVTSIKAILESQQIPDTILIEDARDRDAEHKELISAISSISLGADAQFDDEEKKNPWWKKLLNFLKLIFSVAFWSTIFAKILWIGRLALTTIPRLMKFFIGPTFIGLLGAYLIIGNWIAIKTTIKESLASVKAWMQGVIDALVGWFAVLDDKLFDDPDQRALEEATAGGYAIPGKFEEATEAKDEIDIDAMFINAMPEDEIDLEESSMGIQDREFDIEDRPRTPGESPLEGRFDRYTEGMSYDIDEFSGTPVRIYAEGQKAEPDEFVKTGSLFATVGKDVVDMSTIEGRREFLDKADTADWENMFKSMQSQGLGYAAGGSKVLGEQLKMNLDRVSENVAGRDERIAKYTELATKEDMTLDEARRFMRDKDATVEEAQAEAAKLAKEWREDDLSDLVGWNEDLAVRESKISTMDYMFGVRIDALSASKDKWGSGDSEEYMESQIMFNRQINSIGDVTQVVLQGLNRHDMDYEASDQLKEVAWEDWQGDEEKLRKLGVYDSETIGSMIDATGIANLDTGTTGRGSGEYLPEMPAKYVADDDMWSEGRDFVAAPVSSMKAVIPAHDTAITAAGKVQKTVKVIEEVVDNSNFATVTAQTETYGSVFAEMDMVDPYATPTVSTVG